MHKMSYVVADKIIIHKLFSKNKNLTNLVPRAPTPRSPVAGVGALGMRLKFNNEVHYIPTDKLHVII